MKKIKNFSDFSDFASTPDLMQVYLFTHSDAFSFSHVDHAVRSAASKMFDFLTPPGIFPESVRKGVPVYNYGNEEEIAQLIKDGRIDRKDVYNAPGNLKYANDKQLFHKRTEDLRCVPETVFDKESAMKLKFPVIAKPKDGSKGQGIEVFDTPEQLRSSDGKFDVFSHKFDLQREFRVISVRGEISYLAERIPVNQKAKSLRESEDVFMRKGTMEGRSEYVWKERQFGKGGLPDESRFVKICKDTHDRLELDVLGIDIGIDSKGKLWLIEANTCPGLNNDQVVRIYLSVFRDYYGRDPEPFSMAKIKEIQKELRTRSRDKVKFAFHSKTGKSMDFGYNEDPDRKSASVKFDIEKSFGRTLRSMVVQESVEHDRLTTLRDQNPDLEFVLTPAERFAGAYYARVNRADGEYVAGIKGPASLQNAVEFFEQIVKNKLRS